MHASLVPRFSATGHAQSACGSEGRVIAQSIQLASAPSKDAYRSGLAGPKMSCAAASVSSRVCRPLFSSLMACRNAAKCSFDSRARALRPSKCVLSGSSLTSFRPVTGQMSQHEQKAMRQVGNVITHRRKNSLPSRRSLRVPAPPSGGGGEAEPDLVMALSAPSLAYPPSSSACACA